MKRLVKRRKTASSIGSPYIHKKINELITTDTNHNKNMSSQEFLVAKQLLADLPIVPTSERIYDLTDQLKLGLLDFLMEDGVFDVKTCHDNWKTCLEATKEYLRGIGILNSDSEGGVIL